MRFVAPLASEMSLEPSVASTPIVATDSLKLARLARQRSFEARQKAIKATRKQRAHHKKGKAPGLTALATRKCIPIDTSKPPPAPTKRKKFFAHRRRNMWEGEDPKEVEQKIARFRATWDAKQKRAIKAELDKRFNKNQDENKNDDSSPGADPFLDASGKRQREGKNLFWTTTSGSDADESMEIVTPEEEEDELPDEEIEAMLNAEPTEYYKYEPHEVRYDFSALRQADPAEATRAVQRHYEITKKDLHRRYGLYRANMAEQGKVVPENPPDFEAMKEWEHERNRQAFRNCNVRRHRDFILMRYPRYARRLDERIRKAQEEEKRLAPENGARTGTCDVSYSSSSNEAGPGSSCSNALGLEIADSRAEVDEVEMMLPLEQEHTLTQSQFDAHQDITRPSSPTSDSDSDCSSETDKLPDPPFLVHIQYYSGYRKNPPSMYYYSTFPTVPWPLLFYPTSPSEITPFRIQRFLQTSVAYYFPPPSAADTLTSASPLFQIDAAIRAAMGFEECLKYYPHLRLDQISHEERIWFHVQEVASTEKERWEMKNAEWTIVKHVQGREEKFRVREGVLKVYKTLCRIAEGERFEEESQ